MFNSTLLDVEGFSLSFKGHTTSALPVDATAEEVTVESFKYWGGAGMSQFCPRFWRGRHETSPSRGLI